MDNLEIICIPLLKDNYGYLLHDPATGDTAVIDPAEASPILAILAERNWKLKYIFNTHHHFDHIGGNQEIKKATKCKIIASYHDRLRIPGVDMTVREGDEIPFGHCKAKVLEIPGHTIGHIAYYFADHSAVFCGDTLFSLGCGKLFEGTPSQMWSSLRRLGDLPSHTKVYCGHEYTLQNGHFALTIDPHNPALQARCAQVADLRVEGKASIPSTIGMEVETNPFLRAPLFMDKLGLPLNSPPEAAFATLRQLKDSFIS